MTTAGSISFASPKVSQANGLQQFSNPGRVLEMLGKDKRPGIFDNMTILGKKYDGAGDIIIVAKEKDSGRTIEIPFSSLG